MRVPLIGINDSGGARIQEGVSSFLEREYRRISSCQARIPSLVVRRLSDARLRLLTVHKDLMQSSVTMLSRYRHKLELLQQRIADASPDKLLARGYSITLKNGVPVTDLSGIVPGDEIVTRLHKGELTSIVNRKSSNRKSHELPCNRLCRLLNLLADIVIDGTRL